MYLARAIEPVIAKAARQFAAVVVTGPRRAGKTTLLRRLFPKASYVLLEDPDVVARVRADPRGFVEGLRLPVILDEIQNAPELFAYVRTKIDAAPSRRGRFLFTGSQEAPLMRGVTESLAGRAALFQLLPLSTSESPKVSLFRGGFPEVIAKPGAASVWFRSYVQTYLERDVRAVLGVKDLATFRRFLGLVASRVGQMLNKTDLAAPLGISVPTVTEWLSVLEITGEIIVAPPYFESFGKRIVKSPKIFFGDTGLACSLLGIESRAELERSPFLGPLFESFVAAEIVKQQVNAGKRPELYWFRDQQGLEVDFVVPRGNRRLLLVETKASHTVTPSDAAPIERLAKNIDGYKLEQVVVHRPTTPSTAGTALRPGVSAVSVASLAEMI